MWCTPRARTAPIAPIGRSFVYVTCMLAVEMEPAARARAFCVLVHMYNLSSNLFNRLVSETLAETVVVRP